MNNNSKNPIFSLAERELTGVLAMVISTVGPSYRSVGACMVFADDGTRTGSLSSGCIESDLAHHADAVRASGLPKVVTYGVGSPFIDIKLPCGGALEILLIAQPKDAELDLIREVIQNRIPKTVSISKQSGVISDLLTNNAFDDDNFKLTLMPPLRFCVFGKGPEAENFAHLAQALGYEGTLLSPDPETLESLPKTGWQSVLLLNKECPTNIGLDDHTAAVLFFHDHEWEAPILKGVLNSDAFYIGAQGSKRAGQARLFELQALGVSEAQCARIVGPIGLIPSTRDPQTLAVSVLAEILHKAQSIRSKIE